MRNHRTIRHYRQSVPRLQINAQTHIGSTTGKRLVGVRGQAAARMLAKSDTRHSNDNDPAVTECNCLRAEGTLNNTAGSAVSPLQLTQAGLVCKTKREQCPPVCHMFDVYGNHDTSWQSWGSKKLVSALATTKHSCPHAAT